jgi:hypothetical protein
MRLYTRGERNVDPRCPQRGSFLFVDSFFLYSSWDFFSASFALSTIPFLA